jgi:hypothetical protein
MALLCAVCKVARNSDYLLVGLCGMDLQQSILTRKAIYVSLIKVECYATVEISKDLYHVRLISDPDFNHAQIFDTQERYRGIRCS